MMKSKSNFLKAAGLLFLCVFLLAGCAANQESWGDVYEYGGSRRGNSGSGGSAASAPTIRVVNNTDYPIWDILMSDIRQDSYGEDWMDEDEVLSVGSSREIRLPTSLSIVNRYNFMLVDDGGYLYTKSRVRLTADAQVVFTPEDLDAKTITRSDDPNLPLVTIVNNTGSAARHVRITPPLSTMAGNILGLQSLLDSQSITVRLAWPLSQVSVYDVYLITDEDTYFKNEVQIRDGAQIVFSVDVYHRAHGGNR
jgi:hypothetical protein